MKAWGMELKTDRFAWRLVYGISGSLIFVGTALFIGLIHEGLRATLSLIAISIVLEAQPAAVASIPLGFHPLIGVIVSILSNLILIPIILLTLDEVKRWKWVQNKLVRAEKWTVKYQKYGAWTFTLLAPFLGAYMCIAIGFGLQWSQARVLISVAVGMVLSSIIVAYGGHFGWEILRFCGIREIFEMSANELQSWR